MAIEEPEFCFGKKVQKVTITEADARLSFVHDDPRQCIDVEMPHRFDVFFRGLLMNFESETAAKCFAERVIEEIASAERRRYIASGLESIKALAKR